MLGSFHAKPSWGAAQTHPLFVGLIPPTFEESLQPSKPHKGYLILFLGGQVVWNLGLFQYERDNNRTRVISKH